MSAKLNERTDKTKKNIHLLVTPLCDRNCPHCHIDSDNAYNYCPNCGAEMRGSENDK